MSITVMACTPARKGSGDRAAPGLLGWAERGLIPDVLVRHGIRRLSARRLQEERAGGPAEQALRFQQRIGLLRTSPLA
ncbi:MAG: hypothetical protein ACRET0_15310 [Steroidobacteraceae bacterium]